MKQSIACAEESAASLIIIILQVIIACFYQFFCAKLHVIALLCTLGVLLLCASI